MQEAKESLKSQGKEGVEKINESWQMESCNWAAPSILCPVGGRTLVDLQLLLSSIL